MGGTNTELLKDTLSVTLQNCLVRLVGVLHGNSLWEFTQHPLLEGLQPLVVVAAADKLFVLMWTNETKDICTTCTDISVLDIKSSTQLDTLRTR